MRRETPTPPLSAASRGLSPPPPAPRWSPLRIAARSAPRCACRPSSAATWCCSATGPCGVWGWAAPGEAVRVGVGSASGEATGGARRALERRAARAAGRRPVHGDDRRAQHDHARGRLARRGLAGLRPVEHGVPAGPLDSAARTPRRPAATGCACSRWPRPRRCGRRTTSAGSGWRATRRRRPASPPSPSTSGRSCTQALGVKIGLVHSSWGGTPGRGVDEPRGARRRAVAAAPGGRLRRGARRPAGAGRRSPRGSTPGRRRTIQQDTGNEGAAGAGRGRTRRPRTGSRWTSRSSWEKAGLAIDGAVWFRRDVEIPAAWAGKDLRLSLGPLDDFDTTYFAGEEVGRTGKETPGYYVGPAQVHGARTPREGRPRGDRDARLRPLRQRRLLRCRCRTCGSHPPTRPATPLPLAGPWEYKVERALPPATPDFGTQPRAPSAGQPEQPDGALRRDDRPAHAVRDPRRHLVPGREQRRCRVPVPHAVPGDDPRLAPRLGRRRLPVPLRPARELHAAGERAGRQHLGRAARGADDDARAAEHRHGRRDRHRRGGRHPPARTSRTSARGSRAGRSRTRTASRW